MSDKKVHLAFFWHMHQPSYVDAASQKMILPWVRLHGASAYREMAALLEQHPGIKATVNLSPSLLDQLEFLTQGGRDTYEEATLKPAEELTEEERCFIVEHFFSVNWAQVLAPMPYYQALLEKRGQEIAPGTCPEVAARFSSAELRDLQVLFNLAWIGHNAAHDAQIQALMDQGRGFSEEDKRVVLEKQRDALSDVLPAWKALSQRGSVELCCSPYHHPILPLLVDSNTARRANPETRLPERFCFPQDAAAQIRGGRQRVQQCFGVQPAGLWPPEGAVSPEVAQIVAQQGLTHMTLDSEILFRSLDDRGSTPGKRRLYQPYTFGDLTLFFRDTQLSQRIQREYCAWGDARAAAEDTVAQIRQAAQDARVDRDAPPLVLLAMDGENPWEAFPRRGQDYLQALYSAVAEAPDIQTVTLSEHLQHHPPHVGLEHLQSGSWIEANYAIWIGDADKNRAWNLLGRARRRLARAHSGAEAPPAQLDQALQHLYQAEASDWFWWLGEPFCSVEEPLYDSLFRSHLSAMYRALGESPPADLLRPTAQGGVVTPLREPTSFVHPRIDGSRTSFYEWRGAGFYRVPASGSTFQKRSFISSLYWGFDAGRLFLRLDPSDDPSNTPGHPLEALDSWFELTGPQGCIVGTLKLGDSPERILLTTAENGGKAQDLGVVEEIAAREVVEMAIPLSRIGAQPEMRMGLSFHFSRNGELISRVPRQGVIEIQIPGDEFDAI